MNSSILLSLAVAFLGLSLFFSNLSEEEAKSTSAPTVNQSFGESFPEFLVNLDDDWNGFDEEQLHRTIWENSDSLLVQLEFRTYSDNGLNGSIRLSTDTIGSRPVFYKYTIDRKAMVLRMYNSRSILKFRYKIKKLTKESLWLKPIGKDNKKLEKYSSVDNNL